MSELMYGPHALDQKGRRCKKVIREFKETTTDSNGNGNGAKTKDLITRPMAVHVRYNSLYISLPSSAKQQREMTKYSALSGERELRFLSVVVRLSKIRHGILD